MKNGLWNRFSKATRIEFSDTTLLAQVRKHSNVKLKTIYLSVMQKKDTLLTISEVG